MSTTNDKQNDHDNPLSNPDEQDSNKMTNILRDFADWTLVIVAFGLVAASLYHMGIFDWLSI